MNSKVRWLFEHYKNTLAANYGISTFPVFPIANHHTGTASMLNHAMYMAHSVLGRADAEGWSERKVNRWLGFLQGILWTTGAKGLVDLKGEARHLYDDEKEAVAIETLRLNTALDNIRQKLAADVEKYTAAEAAAAREASTWDSSVSVFGAERTLAQDHLRLVDDLIAAARKK